MIDRWLASLAPLARPAFWAALAFALIMALLPEPPLAGFERIGDKFEHMLAFAALTVLAQIGFTATPRWRLAERLSFLGALIEVLQAMPLVHRDCDIRDWIADTVTIVLVTALFAARDTPKAEGG